MPRLPGVDHRRAVAAFRRAGFEIVREGRHIVMTDGDRTLIIPRHDPINAFTMAQIVLGSGMTIDRFRSLL